jgi:23S rRNA pseudouridine1911/1915/1917 synthase
MLIRHRHWRIVAGECLFFHPPKMPEGPDRIQFFADRGDARLRLDQILVRRVTAVSRMSRNVAQQWIESGAVAVDGRPARRPSSRVREGATIAVTLPATATRRSEPHAEAVDVQVLYEDDTLIAIDKPAGIVVHPSYKQLSGTLLNAVLWRIRDRIGARPGIVTRLDKDTSGIVVVALSAEVHAAMQRDGSAGRIRKEYLAIVSGAPRPAAGTIREPLGRDPVDRRRVIVTPGGAESETRYQVIRSCADESPLDAETPAPAGLPAHSLVRCELLTGRTHQIRVHLQSRGWPIVGDRVYGTADERITRQALHAWRITLPHPVSRDPLTIEAPLPDDMLKLAGSLWPVAGDVG